MRRYGRAVAERSEFMNMLPLRPATLIGALMVAPLLTPSPRAQAQTTTTTGQNATTNSQLANANTDRKSVV